jgi:hypothetical protein
MNNFDFKVGDLVLELLLPMVRTLSITLQKSVRGLGMSTLAKDGGLCFGVEDLKRVRFQTVMNGF